MLRIAHVVSNFKDFFTSGQKRINFLTPFITTDKAENNQFNITAETQ